MHVLPAERSVHVSTSNFPPTLVFLPLSHLPLISLTSCDVAVAELNQSTFFGRAIDVRPDADPRQAPGAAAATTATTTSAASVASLK